MCFLLKDQTEEIKEESNVKVKLEPEDIKKEKDSETDSVFEGPLPKNANVDNRTRVETCTSRKAYGEWVTYEEEYVIRFLCQMFTVNLFQTEWPNLAGQIQSKYTTWP